LEIVPPIRRKHNRFPGPTLHCKRRDKDKQLRAARDRRRKDVIIFYKPGGKALADVELYKEADGKEHHDGGIDANGEIPEVPADDRCDEVLESGLWKAFVEEVGGKRNEEANGEGEDDPLVSSANTEHVFGEGAKGSGLGGC
jgi:hypothetical protein